MMRRAFTLLETLIALGLMIALAGSLFTFFFNLLATRDFTMNAASQDRVVSLLIDRLERDLSTCIVGRADAGSGLRGSSDQIVVLTRAVAIDGALSAPRDVALADLQRSSYRFTGGQIEFRRDRDPSGARGVASGVEAPIHKVRFRYHDGSSWRDSFDALGKSMLPVAVEVAVWFDPWEAEGIDEESGFITERVTFDLDEAFADDDRVEPRPDRLRVIAIPDGGAVEAEEDPDA